MCDYCGVIFVELNDVWPIICKSAPEVNDIVYLLLYLTGLMSPTSLKNYGMIALFLRNICKRNNQFQAKPIIELRQWNSGRNVIK